MSTNLSEVINDHFAKEEWKAGRERLEGELRQSPEDHWLLARLATTYYEERHYEKALELAQQAKALAPECPLVLWEYAGALQALGKDEEAIAAYSHLLAKEPRDLADDECGEGMKWTISLLTDVLFRVGLSLQRAGRSADAIAAFKHHLVLLANGAESIYEAKDAEKRLKELRLSSPSSSTCERKSIRRELTNAKRDLAAVS